MITYREGIKDPKRLSSEKEWQLFSGRRIVIMERVWRWIRQKTQRKKTRKRCEEVAIKREMRIRRITMRQERRRGGSDFQSKWDEEETSRYFLLLFSLLTTNHRLSFSSHPHHHLPTKETQKVTLLDCSRHPWWLHWSPPSSLVDLSVKKKN